MSVSIETVEPKLFDGVVADELVASIADAIAAKGSCSLVLVGGKTPASIYRALSKPPRIDEVDWAKVRLYWGDERWVPHTDNHSNFKMSQETLLFNLSEKDVRYYPVNTALKTPQDGAKAYAELIAKTEGLAPGKMPAFDIVILGVGEDGHTASIFPGSPVFKSTGFIVHAVQHPEDKGYRITLSPEALIGAGKILFIAKGENKAEIVKDVLEGNAEVEAMPARLYTQAKGKVTWFLDSGAAMRLEKKAS